MKIEVPFTDEQVSHIKEFQTCGFHPFTCKEHSETVLEVDNNSFYCLLCDYTQNWCHDFMADGSFAKDYKNLLDKIKNA